MVHNFPSPRTRWTLLGGAKVVLFPVKMLRFIRNGILFPSLYVLYMLCAVYTVILWGILWGCFVGVYIFTLFTGKQPSLYSPIVFFLHFIIQVVIQVVITYIVEAFVLRIKYFNKKVHCHVHNKIHRCHGTESEFHTNTRHLEIHVHCTVPLLLCMVG